MDFSKIFDFAGDFPDGAKYVGALVVVLILILFVSWLLKKITQKVRTGGRRGGRLKVQESIMIDASRTLTLVRCDNVEHLILLSGTNDLVVAANIQKSTSAVKNAPLTVALAPTVPAAAPQPLASPMASPQPAASPVEQTPQQAPQPAPHKPPQQQQHHAPTQPLPTPAPRTGPMAPPQQPVNPPQRETTPGPQSVQAETARYIRTDTVGNGGKSSADDTNGGQATNSSLSNIRPGDDK